MGRRKRKRKNWDHYYGMILEANDAMSDIMIEKTGLLEEKDGELEELTSWVREVANAIESDDTSSIFSCFGADGKAEWNKEYIVFRLRDLIGECYKDENGKERT